MCLVDRQGVEHPTGEHMKKIEKSKWMILWFIGCGVYDIGHDVMKHTATGVHVVVTILFVFANWFIIYPLFLRMLVGAINLYARRAERQAPTARGM